MRVLLILAIAAIAAIAILIAFVITYEPLRVNDIPGTFKFKDGTLYAKVRQGDRSGLAVVDTGTSRSVFSAKAFKPTGQVSTSMVKMRFGRERWPVYRFNDVNLGYLHFASLDAFKNSSSTSLLGLDVILSQGYFVISKYGLDFKRKKYLKNSICGPLTLDFRGSDTNSSVSSIYLNVPINGVERRFHLDSGRYTFIEATGRNSYSKNNAGKKFDILLNSLGNFQIEQFYYVDLDFGPFIGKFNRIKWFYNNTSTNYDFIIGSRFFEDFSIEIDFDKKRYCIFRN